MSTKKFLRVFDLCERLQGLVSNEQQGIRKTTSSSVVLSQMKSKLPPKGKKCKTMSRDDYDVLAPQSLNLKS
jgi:hypothetical protein